MTKVNSTLTLNHTRNQWVDLGIHTKACMTHPETCGAASRALSMWLNMNILEYPDVFFGIVSSQIKSRRAALEIFGLHREDMTLIWYDKYLLPSCC